MEAELERIAEKTAKLVYLYSTPAQVGFVLAALRQACELGRTAEREKLAEKTVENGNDPTTKSV